jgi:VanZ family protein
VRRLLLLVIALILYGSFYPFHFDFGRPLDSPLWLLLHSWPATFDRFTMRDGAANVVLYMPLGFIAALALGRRWWAALLVGAGVSTTVEILQVYDAGRDCSSYDIVCNTLGTALGAIAGLAWHRRKRRKSDEDEWDARQKRWRLGPTTIAACWALFQLYPFVPLLSRGHLRASWALFWATPVSFVEAAASAAEWFAAALLAEEALGRTRAGWLSVALVALPVRLLLADRSLTPAEVIGGGVALILWAAIRERQAVRMGAALMATAILFRELAPFQFAARPHAFSWAPFAASFAADRMAGMLVMLRKAFDYGAMVWLLRGIGTIRAGITVAVALLGMEWVQRYLPGRQAEITDSLIALLLTIPLKWDERR